MSIPIVMIQERTRCTRSKLYSHEETYNRRGNDAWYLFMDMYEDDLSDEPDLPLGEDL
jgi:hypothetical protein